MINIIVKEVQFSAVAKMWLSNMAEIEKEEVCHLGAEGVEQAQVGAPYFVYFNFIYMVQLDKKRLDNLPNVVLLGHSSPNYRTFSSNNIRLVCIGFIGMKDVTTQSSSNWGIGYFLYNTTASPLEIA